VALSGSGSARVPRPRLRLCLRLLSLGLLLPAALAPGSAAHDLHSHPRYLWPPASSPRPFIGPQPLAGATVCRGVCGQSLGAGPGAQHVRGGAPRGGGEGRGRGRRAPGCSLVLTAGVFYSECAGTSGGARCVTLGQCAHLSEPQRPQSKLELVPGCEAS
jgi:hypothetical protein